MPCLKNVINKQPIKFSEVQILQKQNNSPQRIPKNKTTIYQNLKTVEMMSKKPGKLLMKLFLQKQKKQNRCRNPQYSP